MKAFAVFKNIKSKPIKTSDDMILSALLQLSVWQHDIRKGQKS